MLPVRNGCRMMKSFRLAPLIALSLLTACATGFSADVKRFQALPAADGQTFYLQPGGKTQGGLEFANYAAAVAQRLTAIGYRQAADAQTAMLVVSLDYGVDKGREKIETTPGYGGFGYGGFGYGGGLPYYYRLNGRYVRPFGYGWYDPFWAGPWGGPQVNSYTVYDSFLDMRILKTADGQSVFEGRAEARTPSNDLTRLVPNLVSAMFSDFPGTSGQRQRITVMPPKKP